MKFKQCIGIVRRLWPCFSGSPVTVSRTGQGTEWRGVGVSVRTGRNDGNGTDLSYRADEFFDAVSFLGCWPEEYLTEGISGNGRVSHLTALEDHLSALKSMSPKVSFPREDCKRLSILKDFNVTETQPNLDCVHIQGNKAYRTNGHWLVEIALAGSYPETFLPGSTSPTLGSASSCSVSARAAKNDDMLQITLDLGDGVLVTYQACPPTTFPSVLHLFPGEELKRGSFHRKAMLGALRPSGMLPIATLEEGTGGVQVTNANSNGLSTVSTVPGSISRKISLDPAYLSMVLKHIPTETVQICQKGGSDAVLFLPENQDTERPFAGKTTGNRFLVMPRQR